MEDDGNRQVDATQGTVGLTTDRLQYGDMTYDEDRSNSSVTISPLDNQMQSKRDFDTYTTYMVSGLMTAR